MGTLLHLETNVLPWRCEALARLDGALSAAGSRALSIRDDWSDYGLADDGEHFRDLGALRSFAAELAAALARTLSERPRSLLVLTDSLVDHHNDEARAGDAVLTECLQAALGRAVDVRALRGGRG